jgi:Pyruvate/2-oxoacid:ferredoxin oxidoreductase delta subunit
MLYSVVPKSDNKYINCKNKFIYAPKSCIATHQTHWCSVITYTRRRSVICGNSETAFQQSYQHNEAYEFSVTCLYA